GARPRRQDDDIAGFDAKLAPLGPAELDGRAAAGDAQHFVRARMKVQERIDAVAPAIAPTMRGKSPLERHGRILLAFQRKSCAINEQRQARIVGRLAVILEAKGLYLGHWSLLPATGRPGRGWLKSVLP